jgi:hypothetical protein
MRTQGFSWARIGLVMPLLAGLLWMGFYSFQYARADLMAQKGRLYQTRWTGMAGADIPFKQRKAAVAAFERALKLDADNPDHHDRAGRILMGMVDHYPLGSRERGQILDTARQHLLKLTQARPAWPYGWIDLALTDQMIGPEHHEELLHALVRAVELGPWEQRVQHAAATLTVLAWPALDAAQRRVLVHSVVYQSRHGDIAALARIVHIMHWEADFCPLVGMEKGWETTCAGKAPVHQG